MPYKNVRHRIIAEKFMVDENGQELKDYKFFTFNGNVKFILVDFGFLNYHGNYYDTEWNLLPLETMKYPINIKQQCKQPDNFDKMLEIAKLLSQDTPFLRVDLYNIHGDIFFGELTFFPGSGLNKFNPEPGIRK